MFLKVEEIFISFSKNYKFPLFKHSSVLYCLETKLWLKSEQIRFQNFLLHRLKWVKSLNPIISNIISQMIIEKCFLLNVNFHRFKISYCPKIGLIEIARRLDMVNLNSTIPRFHRQMTNCFFIEFQKLKINI